MDSTTTTTTNNQPIQDLFGKNGASFNQSALLHASTPVLPDSLQNTTSPSPFGPSSPDPIGSELTIYAVAKYLSSAIVCPLENAKILQQVQFLPSDDYILQHSTTPDYIAANNPPPPNSSSKNDDDYDSNENINNQSEDEFDDDNEIPYALNESLLKGKPIGYVTPPAMKDSITDADGYLIRPTFDSDDPIRPQYQLQPLQGSLMSTVKKVWRHNDEGFFSLWKGQFTGWLHEMLSLIVQPSLEGVLNEASGLEDDSTMLVYLDSVGPNLSTLLVSNIVTGVLLSPLEIARTRLIVQTSNPYHKKYQGTFHCLRTMFKEEGWKSIYTGINLFPTILYHTIIPLFKNATHVIIERVLHISPTESPFKYAFYELCFNILELGIVLPLQTIRRRLHCQIRKQNVTDEYKEFEMVVEKAALPYAGMVDCAKRIMVEEGGVRSKSREERLVRAKRKGLVDGEGRWKRKSRSSWGLRGLYTGFTLHCTAGIIMLGLKALNVIEMDEEL